MNGKAASIAAGLTGTIFFGIFLAHNQTFDLKRKKAPETIQTSYVETRKDTKPEKSSIKNSPILITTDSNADSQVQKPSPTPPPAATNKKAAKTRAS